MGTDVTVWVPKSVRSILEMWWITAVLFAAIVVAGFPLWVVIALAVKFLWCSP